jgi:MYXO-CTERM domain-containing protein
VVSGTNNATVSVSATADTLFLGALVLETRGCSVAGDCSSATKPACNPDTGGCQPCVPNVDNGVCATSPDGPVCVDDGAGGVFCGCSTDGDCGGPASGKICGGQSICIDGCHGAGFGNQCMGGLNCTSHDGTDGTCYPPCTSDLDCVDPLLPHCNTRVGECVECTGDGHCDEMSICDMMTHECEPEGAGGAAGAGGSGGSGSSGGGSGASSGSNSGGGNSGGGNSGGAGANASDGDVFMDGSCGCHTAGDGKRSLHGWLLLLGAACVVVRRRRRDG